MSDDETIINAKHQCPQDIESATKCQKANEISKKKRKVFVIPEEPRYDAVYSEGLGWLNSL